MIEHYLSKLVSGSESLSGLSAPTRTNTTVASPPLSAAHETPVIAPAPQHRFILLSC